MENIFLPSISIKHFSPKYHFSPKKIFFPLSVPLEKLLSSNIEH